MVIAEVEIVATNGIERLLYLTTLFRKTKRSHQMQPQLALISRVEIRENGTPTLKDTTNLSDGAFSLDFITNDLINKTLAFGKTIIIDD